MAIVAFKFHGCVAQISLAHDVVTIENRARLVPADCHRDTFWDSAPHHVSHGSPTQIMKEQLGNFRFCADLCPGDAKVADRFAMRACEHAVIVWHDLNFKYRDFRPPNASTSAPSSANSYSVFSGRD